MPPTQEFEPIRFNPVAGVLAFLVPGAGHVFLGQTRRGLLIGAGVLGLFFGGMFIGGLSVIDSKSGRLENRISFYGQAVVGPVAIVIDRLHQSIFKAVDPVTNKVRALNPGEVRVPPGDPRNGQGVAIIATADPARGERPPYMRSQGKVHEIGLLYTVLAGMLNFIVIIDALFPGGMAKGTPNPAADAAGKGGAVMLGFSPLIAYTPFVDPIDANSVWWLMLPPLAILIAMVYKALRQPSLKGYVGRVAVMALQIVGAMLLLGAGAYLFIMYVAPMVVPVGV